MHSDKRSSQRTWDRDFLDLAKFFALRRSKDPSTQVGAVIASPANRLVSIGYNGFAKGVEDEPARYEDRELKYRLVVHAECNALLFAKRDVTGCTLYTWPFQPCSPCAAMVINAGIARVVAPVPSESIMERWGKDLFLAQKQFQEAGVSFEIFRPTVVVVSGFFNGPHPGHLRMIREAAKLGDKLIVIVNNDAQVLLKGGKLYMNELERMEMMSGMVGVDEVVLSVDTDRSVCNTLEMIRPDIFANGGDVENESQTREADICRRLGIDMCFGVGGEKIQSSSRLLSGVN